MSKAKELLESLKTLPKEMLPEEPATPSFDDSEIEGVELSEEEDKDYHTTKTKSQHGEDQTEVFHKDKKIGVVRKNEKGAHMYFWKDGKPSDKGHVGSHDFAVETIKKYHKKGLI